MSRIATDEHSAAAWYAWPFDLPADLHTFDSKIEAEEFAWTQHVIEQRDWCVGQVVATFDNIPEAARFAERLEELRSDDARTIQ